MHRCVAPFSKAIADTFHRQKGDHRLAQGKLTELVSLDEVGVLGRQLLIDELS